MRNSRRRRNRREREAQYFGAGYTGIRQEDANQIIVNDDISSVNTIRITGEGVPAYNTPFNYEVKLNPTSRVAEAGGVGYKIYYDGVERYIDNSTFVFNSVEKLSQNEVLEKVRGTYGVEDVTGDFRETPGTGGSVINVEFNENYTGTIDPIVGEAMASQGREFVIHTGRQGREAFQQAMEERAELYRTTGEVTGGVVHRPPPLVSSNDRDILEYQRGIERDHEIATAQNSTRDILGNNDGFNRRQEEVQRTMLRRAQRSQGLNQQIQQANVTAYNDFNMDTLEELVNEIGISVEDSEVVKNEVEPTTNYTPEHLEKLKKTINDLANGK